MLLRAMLQNDDGSHDDGSPDFHLIRAYGRLLKGPVRVTPKGFNRRLVLRGAYTISSYLDARLIVLGDANQKVNETLAGMDLQGTRLGWSGMVKIMKESFGYLFGAMALAVVLVY